ncbi:WS/DGAT domain-containing protein [Rhodococcus sp. IEGM 1408]|uniref:WS/DGAT domain-containing protein n=1 Tax=Rhodococcus sp. IEGM 1408 TaxID=3082220 RepID=UPI0029542802|nr:WS/DGAT domain-containing protein [Rhodococcus sp. IEGM 1408]MDV8001327.1 WS/DGAT domain-containing protein [Rhodococcus sp. IEGM 1408]
MRISLRDQLWLHMDHPDNLMYINSLLWFAEVPDWDKVTEAIATRMVGPHPVFRRVPVREGPRWYWEDDPDYDISRHLVRRRLPSPGGRAEAEEHVAEQMGVALPDDRPIWRAEFIEGYCGQGAEPEGALLLFRVQHGMVDGIRLTQLILSLCDRDDDAPLPSVGRDLSSGGGGILGAVGAVGSVGAGVIKDSVGIARGLTGATIRFPVTLTRLARDVTAPGGSLTRVPTRVVESLSSNFDPTNRLTNTYRSVFRMLFEPRSPELSWSGRANSRKEVSWISGLDLAAVKRVAEVHDTTVTTVMIAAVSKALTEYLDAHGDRPVSDINLMVPMSVAPAEEELPEELGNHITIILMRLPLGIDDPSELIDAITVSMNRVRFSFEPHINFATMLGVAVTPSPVANAVIDLFANKTVGQLTSVPGPVSTVRLAGTPVEGMLGWVPMSGDQALGICIFSYNGKVSVGIATDAELVPDPGQVAGMIEGQFATFEGWDDEG